MNEVEEISHSKMAVAAAKVAAELHAAGKMAQELSLVAKNTRTMVVRAGDSARGLKVIAEHFSELADKTIALTRTINNLAINISRASVVGWQSKNLSKSLAKANMLAQNATFVDTLKKPIKSSLDANTSLEVDFRKLVEEMNVRLEDIRTFMRSTDVISVTFRLEAIQTGEYEGILTDMAGKINILSEDIKTHVSSSRELFSSRRAA